MLAAAPDDAEALEQLERLYEASRSAAEILGVARRRAALATGAERLALLLNAAKIVEEVGDPAAALEALRAARAADPEAIEPLLELERLLSRAEPGPELVEVLGALAVAAGDDAVRRVELHLRRAALLEAGPDPRAAIEAYADVLAQGPRDAGAVAGLERLLARPETAPDAARVLEDVHRATGDARKLAALLEVRLATADGSERPGLLAELAALHERLGDRAQAFGAKLRQLDDAVRRGEDAPGVRADLERLAAATGAWAELARALEEALRAKLPARGGARRAAAARGGLGRAARPARPRGALVRGGRRGGALRGDARGARPRLPQDGGAARARADAGTARGHRASGGGAQGTPARGGEDHGRTARGPRWRDRRLPEDPRGRSGGPERAAAAREAARRGRAVGRARRGPRRAR